MTAQGKSAALALVALDSLTLVVAFNLVAYAHGVSALGLPLLQPLLLPLMVYIFGIYLIDGYNTRTDMLSVTYA